MKSLEYEFSQHPTKYFLNEKIQNLNQYADQEHSIIILDENVDNYHKAKLQGWKKIIIAPGENNKSLRTLEQIINDLVALEADRKAMLIGVGGGKVTDITGFAASIYMRGLPFAFVPTTLLSQVDAAIGGKNGINFGLYKNMLGVIRQPEFILFDYNLLNSLPLEEWSNGFAEIIKSACILDEKLFSFLEKNKENALKGDAAIISLLVERSVQIKSDIVAEDEFDNGKRRCLNFGHTIGHAIEKLEGIAHGQAVALGMVAATLFSQKIAGLQEDDVRRIIQLLQDYHLPIIIGADKNEISHLFRMDKKREKDTIHFVLLEKIGRAVTQPIPLKEIERLLNSL